jgi:lipoprotein-anchoring transpeptidase ErfK/SrfK
MRRLSMVVLTLLVGTPPALAQSREWVPWSEYGGKSNQAAAQRQKQKAYQQRSRRSSDDDDDDDYGSVFSGGQLPYRKSTVQYPAVLQGGARPEISPQAPQTVSFRYSYSQGTIVIDQSARALYYVLGNGGAYRYPISVGRDGFSWRGTEKISRVAAWPDWHPPAEMRERDPKLPEVMTGGVNNPLGAKALYLGNSLYRIHGTNDSKSIGYAASSGCFRMMNYHVIHLATLAGPGTSVVVLDKLSKNGDVSQAPSVPAATAKVKRAG